MANERALGLAFLYAAARTWNLRSSKSTTTIWTGLFLSARISALPCRRAGILGGTFPPHPLRHYGALRPETRSRRPHADREFLAVVATCIDDVADGVTDDPWLLGADGVAAIGLSDVGGVEKGGETVLSCDPS
jgi:hypothetical protein